MEAGKDIDSINWNPTGGTGWRMSAPAEASDVDWMNNTLKSRAPRITVHDAADQPADADDAKASAGAVDQALTINWGVLGQP
jgi:hypothetical protein